MVAWRVALMVQGVPSLVATVAAVAMLAALILKVRPQLVDTSLVLHTEALILVLMMAIAIATVPAIADGWHTARALNVASVEPQVASSRHVATLLIVILLMPAALGVAWGLWRANPRC